MNALRVAVVGAGPGGLAVSATLARLGVDVTVFERWNDIRALGGGLALRPPASKALEYLGLNPAEIGAPSQPRYLRPDGRTLAVFPALPSDERMADFPLYLSTLALRGCTPPCASWCRSIDSLAGVVRDASHRTTTPRPYGSRTARRL